MHFPANVQSSANGDKWIGKSIVKNQKWEIAKALQSNGRKDYLYGLKQEYQLYVTFQQKMKECDVGIENLLNEQINNDDEKKQHYIDKKVYKK